MLKHDENQPEQAAGEVRVKKEELARAISILEARRQTEAQAREGTVVIGDVLQQLQINMPAEEVLHEIEALRDGQPQEEVLERPVDPLTTANAKLIAGIVLVPLAAVVLGGLIFNPFRAAAPMPVSGPNMPRGSVPLWLPSPATMSHLMPPNMTSMEMNEGGFNASSVLKPLSAVPDNQPVHCNSDSLRHLLNDQANFQTPPPFNRSRPFNRSQPFSMQAAYQDRHLDAAVLAKSDQKFDVRPGLQKSWQMIKHDGNLYVRGWVTAKFTQVQGQERPVSLHADPHSFDAGIIPQQITLKADFTPTSDFGRGFGPTGYVTEILVQNAAPDSHAWEKW